jgi:hypothetical protein
MNTAEYDAIIRWLERRVKTFSNDNETRFFVRQPATGEKVKTAQDTFNLLLSEARNERQLCVERGGYLITQLPAMLISNQQ